MIYNIVTKDQQNEQVVISSRAKMADSFLLRLVGLMFRKSIGPEQALIFHKASSIHSCFMRFPIDIIFLDKNNKIIRICDSLRAWRFVFAAGSCLTIELPAHISSQKGLKVGDFLQIVPVSSP